MGQIITPDEARERIAHLVRQLGREEDAQRIEQSLGLGTFFRFESVVWASEVTVEFRANGGYRPGATMTFETGVTWSSTRRSLAAAESAMVNYRRALDFAHQLQAFCDGLPEVRAAE